VAVAHDRADERGRAGDLSKQRRIVPARCRSGSAAELFREAKELSP
jgi:hypothetical protein